MKRIGTVATAGALLGLIMPSATLAQIAMPTLPVAPKKEVSPVLAGDDKLTCPQILAETQARQKEFDAALDEADNTKVAMSAQTAGLLAAHEAIATAVPLATKDMTKASAAAISGSATAYLESSRADERKTIAPIQQRADFARVRSDYLNDLYRNKCFKKGAAASAAVPMPAAAAAISAAGTPATAAAAMAAAGAGSGGAPNCAALKAEGERLRQQLDLQTAATLKAAQSYRPGQGASAARKASMAANLATVLAPGLGGLVSSAASAASSAAQQAAHEATVAKFQNMADEQMALGQRITEIEVAYEDNCKP